MFDVRAGIHEDLYLNREASMNLLRNLMHPNEADLRKLEDLLDEIDAMGIVYNDDGGFEIDCPDICLPDPEFDMYEQYTVDMYTECSEDSKITYIHLAEEQDDLFEQAVQQPSYSSQIDEMQKEIFRITKLNFAVNNYVRAS